MTDWSIRVNELSDSQFREWKLARDNYRQLDDVRVRSVSFSGYELSVQFNPGRITSSAAKVDAKAIEARPCFLCGKNRSPEQRGVPFGDEYEILINPFPIFRRHLTIVSGTVQVGTANFVNPHATTDILEGMQEYLRYNNIKDVNEVIGTFNEGVF